MCIKTLLMTAASWLMLSSGSGYGATLFYLSSAGAGEGAAPASPYETFEYLPTGGTLHVWVQPDQLFTGVSLDIQQTGSAIRFTGASVYNPAVGTDTRWLPGLIRHGTVADNKVSRIEGGALASLSGYGEGVGPATASNDGLYESDAGFLFAAVDFAVVNASATSTVSIAVGHNLLSDAEGIADGTIFFGADDGPISITSGASGATIDLSLTPRPLHPSDFEPDGEVDGADQVTWQRGAGTSTGATRSQGDADSDGAVDGDDLALWEAQYGTVPTQTTSVAAAAPEPTTLVCALLSCGMFAASRPCRLRGT